MKRTGQYNQQQIAENNCHQGPQSPIGGGSMQNSWSSVASNNTSVNHTGAECDVNSINYGQPPPGHTQHQQVNNEYRDQ